MLSLTHWHNFLSTISLTLLLNVGLSNSTLANESKSRNFPTGEREGAGVRGETIDRCQDESLPPIPLIPQNSVALTTIVPKLLFYVPHSERQQILKFLLLDENNRIVYQKILIAEDRSKIVNAFAPVRETSPFNDGTSFDFVKNSSNILAVDRLYHWYIVKECNFAPVPQIVVDGSLQRIQLDRHLSERFKQAKPLERAKLYRETGMWSEALDSLLDRYCDRDKNAAIEGQLKAFLESAGVNSIDREALDFYCWERANFE